MGVRERLTVAVEQNLLSFPGCRWITFELGIYHWIIPVFRIQHLCLSAVLLKQCPQEGSSTSTIFGMIWPR
jgi:hypothetical protein